MLGVKTLDVYIGRRFFMAILGVFLLCSVLIYMIDFIELLRQSGKRGSGSIGALALLAILRLPAYTEFLLGFAVLVGSIFALLMLARRSELAVMRSAGMSVWVFLRSGVFVAFALGVFFVVVFNPMASQARDESEELYAEVFGKDAGLFRRKSSGIWLRQDGADGQSVLSAGHVSRKGQRLMRITAFQFDREGKFSERIDASEAVLKEGFWQLKNALVARPDKEPSVHKTYLISTYLTPERVNDALGSAISISFWDLPRMIKAAEIAKISSSRLRIQYELLLSRPLLCLAMVLLAATVSLRSFRSGGIQTMVVTGMVGGLGFFLLAEVSRQIGMAGLASPRVAVWMPVLVTILVSLTVLLHQEDG